MSKKRHIDEFDDPSNGDKFMSLLSLGGRGFAAGAVCAAIVLLALVLWIAYPSDDNAGGEVPIIRADAGDYAARPDAPGGMDIPHRDSTIFSAQGNPDGQVENLLADTQTEAPLPKSDLFAGLNTTPKNTPPQPQAEPMKEPVASEDLVPAFETSDVAKKDKAATTETTPAPAAQPTETATSAPQPVTAPADTALAAPAAEVAKAEPAAGAATAAPKAIADGTHFVQLASITDKAKADAAYKDLQKKYPALSGVSYRVDTADLGAKGTFYRIQAGPVSKADADKACAAIKSASGSCLIVAK